MNERDFFKHLSVACGLEVQHFEENFSTVSSYMVSFWVAHNFLDKYTFILERRLCDSGLNQIQKWLTCADL